MPSTMTQHQLSRAERDLPAAIRASEAAKTLWWKNQTHQQPNEHLNVGNPVAIEPNAHSP